MTVRHVEREVKMAVWPGFALPDLHAVLDGVSAAQPEELDMETVYYDTADVRLARAGITLRYREGGGGAEVGGAWTIKLPRDASGEALERDEIVVPGRRGPPPAEVHLLVRAWIRSARLRQVARLCTRRQRTELTMADGVVAEVVDDAVTVRSSDRPPVRFREVEVEIADGAPPNLLPAVVDRLRAAGAGPHDPVPKAVRALGPHALGPPDLECLTPGREAPAGDLLRAAFTTALMQLLHHDVGVRLDENAEAVHQARVATRRMRAQLRVFRDLLEDSWSVAVGAELKKLAAALGAVRDADVLRERLSRQAAALSAADAEPLGHLFDELGAQRAVARAELLTVLDSRWYVRLLDQLVDGARLLHVSGAARRPACEVAAPMVDVARRRLTNQVRRARRRPTDDELHEIRVLAKRCRYAADVAEPVIGEPAHELSRSLAKLQDTLGGLQDAAVSEAWLRRASVARPSTAFVAGQLVSVQKVEAARSRERWRRDWKRVRKVGWPSR